MSSPIRLVRSETLSDVAEYAYGAVVAPGARLVFAAGACPLDADGQTVGVGDYAAQARQMMHNLEIALRDAGAGCPTWSRRPCTSSRTRRPTW